jgi:Arabinose efflux permease
MSHLNSRGARLALVAGHMAGMIDIAALPVWVGTLIGGFGFSPAMGGGLATIFLAGVVLSSVLLSPVFHRMPGRWMPTLGFTVAALAFLSLTRLEGFVPFAIAHAIAGFSVGLAISFVHGTMAHTTNPHRIFAMGSLALGVFAVFFLGGAPGLIAKTAPTTLFFLFGGIMAFGALVTGLLFPAASENEDVIADKSAFDRRVWFVILGVMCMALIHAMIFSFAERIGAGRGFDVAQIQAALAISGLVAIAPSILATLLEKRLPPMAVAITGVSLQALVSLTLTRMGGYDIYVACLIAMPFIMLFSHTFVFGHLARIDPTGRANAATPAMIMTGSATGPLLGGILVQSSGFPALGIAAAVIGLISITAFSLSCKGAKPGREAQA